MTRLRVVLAVVLGAGVLTLLPAVTTAPVVADGSGGGYSRTRTLTREFQDNGETKVVDSRDVTLSVDHRVIDGALGAQLLEAIVHHLENPMGMLA